MLVGYLIRNVITLARAFRHRKTLLLEEVRFPMRVWLTDLDIYGHLNNGRFLTLMDQGRLFHALVSRLLPLAFERRWKPVASAAFIVFRSELKWRATFQLVSRVVSWDERAFYLEHRMESPTRLYARAFVRVVFTLKKGTVAPKEVARAMGHVGPAPEASEALRAFIEAHRTLREASPAPAPGSASPPPGQEQP
ncbi:MAG: thioesterase [Betaproteobacteria bacterium]|nr:thioesterase [Betaproteobacteria bacterium]